MNILSKIKLCCQTRHAQFDLGSQGCIYLPLPLGVIVFDISLRFECSDLIARLLSGKISPGSIMIVMW